MNPERPLRIHLLTQYLWPDSAPTGLLAESLADALSDAGHDVVLVGGNGSYRSGSVRPEPATRRFRLEHSLGKRSSLISCAIEYRAVTDAFRRYIASEVRRGDVVIVTSAPPTTIGLAHWIRARGAQSIYWLQDYYPELLRTLWNYPQAIRNAARTFWDDQLAKWDHVVKAAGNLDYHGMNSHVIRNWPTMDLGESEPAIPGTALYSGNLGYCHHLPSFIALCEKLRDEGYKITVRGDGVGRTKLPRWIHTDPTLQDMEALRRSYWQAEVHLVAAHPDIRGAVFPSKFWNSYATGREIRTSGFAGEMLEELEAVKIAHQHDPKSRWTDFIGDLATSEMKSGKRQSGAKILTTSGCLSNRRTHLAHVHPGLPIP